MNIFSNNNSNNISNNISNNNIYYAKLIKYDHVVIIKYYYSHTQTQSNKLWMLSMGKLPL